MVRALALLLSLLIPSIVLADEPVTKERFNLIKPVRPLEFVKPAEPVKPVEPVKPSERISLPRNPVYLTLAEGIRKAQQEGRGLGVVRGVAKHDIEHYRNYAESIGFVFCVAGDDDTNVPFGAWTYQASDPFLRPVIRQAQPIQQAPVQYFRGRSC